ncbi:MAG TPA: TonB-dependent receptor [Vicinamibacteria bacterium]|nr:TonB-dependent receptor [Vicinamibacteria bacterium]
MKIPARIARRMARNALLLAALAGPTAPAWAQLELGELRGRVLDPHGSPVSGARVVLLDQRGARLRSVASDEEGRFVFGGVAPGSYYLRASRAPLASGLRTVVVGDALAVDLELRLAARTAEALVVTPGPERPALATRTSLSGESVRQVPGRLAGRGLRAAVATTGGWATEDNGLIHLRGVDDGFLLVIDGVPLYERFDVLFGVAPEPALVSSLNVITGHLPAEFGLKAGGVIEIDTSAGPRRTWSGALEASAGSESTHGASAQAVGPLAGGAVLELSVSGERSHRFLDPVHPDNLHNRGSAYHADARVALEPSPRDAVRLGVRYGRAAFDVPNSDGQEEAGQDQRQRVRHALALASWQRHWSAGAVSQLAIVGSFKPAELRPSPNDVPLSTTARQESDRVGLLGSVTRGLGGGHVVKGGFEASWIRIDEAFAFHVTDAAAAEDAELSEAALGFDADRPFVFAGRRSGLQLSGYLQDTWSVFPGFVLNAGLRFDRSALPRPETSWGPRVGAAYRPSPGTALRASVNRYFQPPQPEWLLLASSEQARVLSPFAEEGSGGGAEPRAERQTGLEVGWEQRLGGEVRLDLALWHRRATDVSDPNVLFGTTIIFPNSVAKGRARGLDLRLEVPRRSLGGYLGYTLSKVDQFGPIVGGLFLEDTFSEIGPGTRFTPDHDQRHTGALGVSLERERFWLQASGRYESGTPLEALGGEAEELRERPGADRVDITRGRVKPRTVVDFAAGLRLLRLGSLALEARVEALNVTDAAYAFNFGNPFSGTHFGPPRTFALKLRLASVEPGAASASAPRPDRGR